MNKIHGKDFAPFRFLTPFPHRPPRRLRNSALKPCRFQPDVRTPSFFIRLILSCSNILGGRLHRLPSVDNIVAEKRCWGDPRGYVPLVAGRFLASEKGRQRVAREQVSVGRGKAERFPLQGGSVRLNLQGRSCNSRVFYPHYLEEYLLDYYPVISIKNKKEEIFFPEKFKIFNR